MVAGFYGEVIGGTSSSGWGCQCEWVIRREFGNEIEEGLCCYSGGCSDAVGQNQPALLFDQCLGEVELFLK